MFPDELVLKDYMGRYHDYRLTRSEGEQLPTSPFKFERWVQERFWTGKDYVYLYRSELGWKCIESRELELFESIVSGKGGAVYQHTTEVMSE